MEINQKAKINKRKYVKKCKQMGKRATATTAVSWIYYYNAERILLRKKRISEFIDKQKKAITADRACVNNYS